MKKINLLVVSHNWRHKYQHADRVINFRVYVGKGEIDLFIGLKLQNKGRIQYNLCGALL